jgi:hypothetical protein
MNRDALAPCEFRERLLKRSRAVCTWDGVSGLSATPRVVPWDQCRVCPHVVPDPQPSVTLTADGRAEGQAVDPFVSAYLESLQCPHRGEQIETRTGELCGTRHRRFPVYSCTLHGKCSLTRICVHQRLRNCCECQAAGEHLVDDDRA